MRITREREENLCSTAGLQRSNTYFSNKEKRAPEGPDAHWTKGSVDPVILNVMSTIRTLIGKGQNYEILKGKGAGTSSASELTSTISELVLLSCGSLYSVYFSRTLSMSVLAYWNNLLELLNMMRAISQSHRTLSS